MQIGHDWMGASCNKGCAIETSRDFIAVEGVGPGATELAAEAAALKSLPGEQRGSQPTGAIGVAERDYSYEEAAETFCRVLSGLC